MQVTANQIRKSVNAKYVLWSGERIVARVHQHTGAHGFHSAVIVVERCDEALEVRSWSGYDGRWAGQTGKDKMPMLEWIAAQLTELSTSDEVGCNVEGLLTAEAV